jgi:hypothetical protein
MARTDAKNREAATPLGGSDKRQAQGSQDRAKRQGAVHEDRGQTRPIEGDRAQANHQAERNAGLRAQKDAAEDKLPTPGEPAGGE